MEEEKKLKELIEDNIFQKIRKGISDAWEATKQVKKDTPDVIKRETKETKEALGILMRIVKRQKVSIQEKEFLKNQSVDLSKALGLLAGGIISIPLTIVLVAFLEKKGIKALPQDRSSEITKEEINIMEQALNEIEKEVRVPFEMDLPDDLLVLNDIFTKAGFELYVVGGAVRDVLGGQTPKDYDLATDARPQEILDLLSSVGGYGIKEAGETFPVVHTSTPNHVPHTDIGLYEIATMRMDLGDDHTKPETVYSTIDKDAYRRDLTMNALFFDINSKEIIDFVGGIEDIKRGVVKTVGDPTQRFDEHRIRVMRAVRFSARVGNPLDKGTSDSIHQNNSLGGQPAEAIQTEFLKGIKQAKSVPNYLEMLSDFGLFPQVLPNINVNVKEEIKGNDQAVVLASICRHNNQNKLFKSLMAAKYPKDFARTVCFLVDLKSLNKKTAKAKRDKQFASTEQISEATKLGIGDPDVVRVFLDFINMEKVSGGDAESAGVKKGTREMGVWISQEEEKRFLKLLE